MNASVPQLLLDDIVLEEICLDGLEGITVEGLWTRLAARLRTPVSPIICEQLWSYILDHPEIHLYELAEPREPLRIFDRRELHNLDTGAIQEPEPGTFTTYPYVPINKNGEMGSCSTYDTRRLVATDSLRNCNLLAVEQQFGRKLIMVGSQKLREYFLYPDNYDPDMDITHIQFCLLERIGRSRYSGEKTIGPHSLIELAKDSTLLFYQRSVVQKYGLVCKQVYIQKIADHHTAGVLLHLPRYYHEYKPQLIFTTEKVVEFLKTKPKFMADYDEVKSLLNSKTDALKNLVKTADFQKVVLADQKVPYRSLYPDAIESEWKSKKYEEKQVRVMVLIDPNVDLSTIWYKEDEPEDITQHFINYENDYFDKSLLRQAFDAIADAKHEGISQSDLAKELGQHKLTTRTLLRNIMKMNVISSYMTDEGRQRITKYILPKYTQKQDKYVQDLVDLYNSQPTQSQVEPQAGTSGVVVKSEFSARKPITNIDENSLLVPVTTSLPKKAASPPPLLLPAPPTPPKKTDMVILDPSEYSYHRIQPDDIHTTITITNHMPGISKQPSGIGKAIFRNTLPSRYIKRCTMIRNMVHDHKIKDPLDLQKEILSYEKANGEKHNICKKSCYRLLDKLAVDNFIRIILVNFRYKDKEKMKVYVCDTDVTEQDARLQAAIQLHKVTIFCNSIEKDKTSVTRRPEALEAEKASLSAESKKRPSGKKKEAGVLLFSMSPKFFKMKTFHEYAFSLIYEPVEKATLHRTEVVAKWQSLHGSVDFDEILQEAGEIHCADIGWRMFVPPLPFYDGYPTGWALLSDLVARLPLSIFVNVNNLFKYIPNLSTYLDHPIKRHFLVRNLPAQLRNDLYHKRKYLFSVDEIVRHLCFIGLLQFGNRRLVIKDQIYVYINRQASFLDTTMSEPGYNTVSPADYPAKAYTFNRTVDLVEYWNDLQTVCTTTKLNKRDTVVGKEIVLHTLMSKPELQPYLEQRTPEMALLHDNGHLPGDHLGAGGLDSAFFAHLKKNWTKTKFKCNVDSSANQRRIDRITKKPIEYGRLKKDINKRYFRAGGGLIAPKKVRLRPIASHAVIRKRRAVGTRTRKIQSRKNPEFMRKLPLYDDIDKDALRLMMKLRVDWQPYEDNNLLLCRVAMKYLSPGARKQYITGHNVRDVLHWMHRGSMNKTSRACSRRIAYMLKTSSEINDSVNLCLEEVRTNPEVRQKFGENFVDNLKQIHKASPENFLLAIKIHFVNLVLLLTKYYEKLASSRYQTRTITLPDTVAALRQAFNVKDSKHKQLDVRFRQPETAKDVLTHTIMLMIHSSMCCAKDKTSWNIQLFEVYKNYTESVLNDAMQMCRSEQLIAQNKTALRPRNNDRNIVMTFNEHFYHLSNSYLNQLVTDMQFDMIDRMYEKLCEFFEQNRQRIEAGSQCTVEQAYMDCSAATIGITLMLGELLSKDVVRFRIDIPDKIITLDHRSNPELTGYEGINARFQDALAYMQTNEDLKGDVTVEPAVKTKQGFRFGHDEEHIAYHLNPVERLMQLGYQYYHFFCLVTNPSGMFSHLFEINENGLCSTETCLFERNLDNIVDTVLVLVERNVGMLTRILSYPLGKTNKGHSYQLGEQNFINFFMHFIEEYEASANYRKLGRKDCGRIVSASFSVKVDFVDVLRDLVELRADYNNDEAWLTRHERTKKMVGDENDDDEMETHESDGLDSDKVRKFHDVLVVNSSRLLITAKDTNVRVTDLTNSNKFEQLDGLLVPKELAVCDAEKRERILADIKSDFTWPVKDRHTDDLNRLMARADLKLNDKTKIFQILEFIQDQEELGATVFALSEKFHNVVLLQRLVGFLWKHKYILRAGIEHVTYIHYKYVEPWTVNSYYVQRPEKDPNSDKRPNTATSSSEPPSKQAKLTILKDNSEQQTEPVEQEDVDATPVEKKTVVIRPVPWIRINGSLNRRVVDRWISAILLHLVSNAGVDLKRLSARFSYLVPVHMRYMLEILQQLGCIELWTLPSAKVGLFSEFSSPISIEATEYDAMEETFVQTLPDAVTKLTMFIGKKPYKIDFIECV